MPGVDYLLPTVETESLRLSVTDGSQGTKIVHGKKVFKTGTFKDSTGTERTWTNLDLEKMVQNFHKLKDGNLLDGVPLRVDHSFSARDLIGWIVNLYSDGNFLLADLHFTEFSAYEKWQKGTFAPVSSEIAPYETNSGEIYYPTLIGVAFVDIPAVEGLYRASGVSSDRVTAVPVPSPILDSGSKLLYEIGQEDLHMPISETQIENNEDVVTEDAPSEDASTEELPTQEVEVVEVESEDEAEAEVELSAVDIEAQIKVLEALLAERVAEESELLELSLNSKSVAVSTFRVNGFEMSDRAAVQAHIDSLEQFRSASIDGERRSFVEGLVRENKILANQASDMTDLSLSMDESQYAKFKSSYQGVGANPLLGAYGNSVTNISSTSGTSIDKIRDEISIHEAVVGRHRLAGKPEEWITKCESFRRLTELNTQLKG